MPRPRTFDQDTVIDAAVGAFWQGGLGATSVDDVLQATGLARSSLYSSFGNKNDILRLAIDRYVDRQIVELDQAFRGRSLHEALEGIFLDIARRNNDGRGCLLINSVNELRGADDGAAQAVRSGFARMAKNIAKLVERAQPHQESPAGIAAEIIGAIAGLRTLQKTGLPPAVVRETARRFARNIAER
ncbi:TetR/AcrR family transcriptional regulator [Thiomonas sp. FB-Cd]|uniref:TetR/AcrR family transcriptional regulator n=1 Tax=Thiomonas sp. FB-Cd TaxID=1158292 RepID=UPI0004DF36C1|nr:TetR/AcrR family transcriptional regulator [Thiomonas sp. FB-Cd]